MGQLTYPDYGVYPSTVIAPEGDLGEIIARLGGPRYRREGRILSYADCNPSLDGWKLTGANVWQEYGAGYSGAGFLKFNGQISPTTNINRELPTTQSLRMGLDIMVRPILTDNRMLAWLYFRKGNFAYIGQWYFYFSTGDVYYGDDTGGFTFLLNDEAIQDSNIWMNLKMVCDGDANPPRYVRLNIDHNEYSMAQNLYQSAIIGRYGMQAHIEAVPHFTTYNLDLGQIIITTNER